MPKELRIPLLLVTLSLATALLLFGRAAVNRHYDYKEQVAPRSLHQMTLESRFPDEADRGNTWLYGAGLASLSVLAFGAFLFAMRDGGEFLRQFRLTTRKRSRRVQVANQQNGPLPTISAAPRIPVLSSGEQES